MASDRRFPAWVVWALLVVVLGLGLWSTLPCLSSHSLGAKSAPFWQRNGYCYSDVIKLYHLRGLNADVLPYSDPPKSIFVPEWTFEYPPGVGFGSYALALLSDTRRVYFFLTAATLTLSAFATVWALDRILDRQERSRARLLAFALAPGLLVFAYHNWDLWAAGIVALGMLAAARGSPRLAAAVFAVGAAFKWWPAVLVILVVVGPWAHGWKPPEWEARPTWRELVDRIDLTAFAVASATWLAFQLPAIAISPYNWWRSISFHLRRAANPDSHVGAFQDFGIQYVGGPLFDGSLYALGAAVAGLSLIGGVLYVAFRVDRGDLPPVDAALVLVITFVLISKVFSPQYILWLLPLAVVAHVPWRYVLFVDVVNAANWLTFAPSDDDSIWLLRVSQVLALVRAAALALIAWYLLRRYREPDTVETPQIRTATGS